MIGDCRVYCHIILLLRRKRTRRKSLEIGLRACFHMGNVRARANMFGQMVATMMVTTKTICGTAVVS